MQSSQSSRKRQREKNEDEDEDEEERKRRRILMASDEQPGEKEAEEDDEEQVKESDDGSQDEAASADTVCYLAVKGIPNAALFDDPAYSDPLCAGICEESKARSRVGTRLVSKCGGRRVGSLSSPSSS
jgi:hypothetical protein